MMKQQLKSSFLLFALIISFEILVAQTDYRPGFIITNEGDSISGLIDYRGDVKNAQQCYFKGTEESEVSVYKPYDILAYQFYNSKRYQSSQVNLNGEVVDVFLEYLVNGILDLYFIRDEGLVNHYFVFSDGKQTYELKNNEIEYYVNGAKHIRNSNHYLGILNYLTKDCPVVKKDVEQSTLSHRSLIKIVSKYHEYICDGEKCIIYEKPIPKLKLIVSPQYGISVSKFHADAYSLLDDQSSIDFSQTFNIGFEIQLPLFNEKISLKLNNSFSNSSFYYNTVTNKSNFSNKIYLYKDYQFNFKNFGSNLMIKYTYPKGKYRPYYSLGFGVKYLKNNSRILNQLHDEGAEKVVLTIDEVEYLLPWYGSVNSELGVNLNKNNQNKYYLNIQYEFDLQRQKYDKSNIHTVSVNLGLNL